jgi:hypothetical protein
MSGSNPPKVLRVAVIVDGESCEELHQTEPGDISIERASGATLSPGPSLELETGIAAEGEPREHRPPMILMIVGALMVLLGGALFAYEVHQHVNVNAVLQGPTATADGNERGTDPTSTIALTFALLGVIPLVTGSTMLRGRRRKRRQQLTVYDGWAQPKDTRKRAPIWLALGILLTLGGAGLFGWEVSKHDTQVELTGAVRGDMSAFVAGERQGTGGLGLLIALIGIVPLVAGIIGLQDQPIAPRKRPPKGSQAPRQHKLFEWVPAEATYYINIPPETRGKLALGTSKATVEQLRQRFGQADNLRVKLGPKAKGKLLIGQTKILFQTARPAVATPKPGFPAEYVDPLALLRPTGLDLAAFAAAAGVAVLLTVWFVYFADRTPTPPPDRYLNAMGIPASYYEKEEEPVEDDSEADALEQKDEKEKQEDKKEDKPQPDDDKLPQPKNVSAEAFQQARGVGVARVLGTYGGPGEGTVLDVIESSENNLGELFAQGMSNTAEYQGGQIGDFVAGGGGITATGTVASNKGIVTGDGPADVSGTDKKERKVTAVAKSSTDNVFGDVDKKAVSATIRQRMPGLQACYEKALRSNPNLKGKMSYTITINPQGRVTGVDVEEDTINDASVKSCTVAKIKGWRFFSEGAEESSEVTFSVSFTGS